MLLIDSFVEDMEKYLGASITKLSIRKSWQEAPPEGAPSDIEKYLKDVVVHTYYYSFYHASDAFRADHMEKFGHKPYVIPFVEQRWASGAAATDEKHTEAMRKLEVYRSWLLATLFKADDKKTLVVLPISLVEPHYQDEKTDSPSYQTATDELYLSPILGAPGMDHWVLDSAKTVLSKSGRLLEVSTGRRMFRKRSELPSPPEKEGRR